MRVGLALPHYDAPDRPVRVSDVVGWAVTAENLGFDSVWMSDHLVFDLAKYGGSDEPLGVLEPLTTLAVIAAETERIRFGTMVLCNEFRHPSVLAKTAATLALASGGRFELGIGAGWYEREFTMTGIPFPPPKVRLDRLEESVEVLKGLFSGEEFTFAGDHYQLERAVLNPNPAHRPKIWIGGKGNRTISMAGRIADGWNAAWFSDPDAYAERAERLKGSDVDRQIGQYAQGSAQEQIDRLAAFADLGVTEAVMCFSNVPFGLDNPEDVHRFAADVLKPAQSL